jgi:ribonuclease G
MSKELVISANRHETRVALIEDDNLCEVYFQRANEYSLAGSIHKGRVTRVLPGMQSAFVDLGLERDTFLYVSDFLEEHEDIDKVTSDDRPARGDRERGRDRDRGRDRHRGDSQQQQASTVQPQGPPPIPVEGSEAPVVEGENGASAPAPQVGEVAAPAGEAAPQRAHQEGDREHRRGRRRRRRGGKGFPESKYAGSGKSGAETSSETEVEAEAETEAEEPAAESAEVPFVLPGESLRKYRNAPPAAAAPVRESVSHEQEHDPQHEEPERVEEDEAHPEPAVQTSPTVGEAAAQVLERDIAEHFPPENAVPDAPIHHPEVAPEEYTSESRPQLAHLVEPPPLPPSAFLPPQELPAELAAEVDVEDAAPLVVSGLDEDEDLDIQAMILGEMGIAGDGPEEGVEEEAAASEPGVDAAPAEGETGTAQVRERGGRYPHRMSRRMRRGRRSGPEGRRSDGRDGRQEERRHEERHSERSQENRGESAVAGAAPERERVVARPSGPSISDLLKEGQEIIVQIAKEPLGQKGARITSHIALPGRYVVFMPTLEHMGVSRKIASDEERQRLKKILQGRRPGPMGGFITRTAAEGRTEDEIAADMDFLYKLWNDIKTKSERRPAPMLLHHDLDIVERILRDQLTDDFKAIWIDNEDVYEHVLGFVQRFQPALVGKVKMYTREAPIFDSFSVTSELEKALRPKVWLKSGGYIVINQTEALVAIDINTGKFVGKSNRLEDTIVKTNTEAIKEIVRQIRLRDLGGIIVIDFIDMDERKNRQKVMQALEEAMRADRAPYKILQFNDFGLVAITRKRVKQSLERTLCAPCPHCDGAGYIKSVQTVVSEILTEARKLSGSVEGKDVMLRVHPDVAKVLKSHQNKYLEELEETLRRPVLVKSDPLLHHEKFDLA